MGLTNTAIKKIRPESRTRRYFDERGLYLEVSPKGGKWWRLKYRFDQKEKRISLGTYPEVSLKDARNRRDESRILISQNIDPSARRKAEKSARLQAVSNSFEIVALEWFEKKKKEYSDKHRKTILQRLEKNVFPYLGSKPVSDIKAPEILDTIRKIESRGAIETARRTLSICGEVFRYAIATGRLVQDPTYRMYEALERREPTHLAAVTEPSRAAEILRAIDGYSGTLPVQCALKLAPLVFVRPGELRHAEWENMDLESGEWRYVVTKTKQDHIVPLASQAIDILKELKPVTGHGKYVFPSARTPRGDRPMSDNAVLSALRRMDIAKDEMSGHGFRAMARTILDEELGFRVDFIEHQLAHSVKDPNGRAYNRTTHLQERKKMMQDWADYLDNIKKTQEK